MMYYLTKDSFITQDRLTILRAGKFSPLFHEVTVT